jgi:uncharacterized protein (TIGR02246 family)
MDIPVLEPSPFRLVCPPREFFMKRTLLLSASGTLAFLLVGVFVVSPAASQAPQQGAKPAPAVPGQVKPAVPGTPRPAAPAIPTKPAVPAKPAAPAQPAQGASATQGQPAAGQAAPAAAPAVDHTADDAALQANIEEFDKAYNARDAKAITALFTPEAQMIDEDGETAFGREAIEAEFSDLFESQPEGVLLTEVDDLKYIGTSLAIENGRTTLIPSPGEPAIINQYMAVHVKTREGKWLMALTRDIPVETLDHTENLLPLAFLIGDWVDESPDAVVQTHYEWSDGDKFLVGKFSAKIAGQNAFSGTQRIGWDPLAKKIRSWVFDSDGGFQEGVWTQVGDQWLIKYQGVSGSGEVTAGTSVLTMVDADRWRWQSRDRILGNEAIADNPEVEVVRRPPPPVDSAEAATEAAAAAEAAGAAEATDASPAADPAK